MGERREPLEHPVYRRCGGAALAASSLRSRLPALKRLKAIDLVVANGENSADGNGITPASAEYLFDSGVDVITTGNHSFRRKESYELYDECETLLRPANFPAAAPGRGLCVVDLGRVQAAVINLMGTAYLESLRCPFETLEELLSAPDLPKVKIVDFHAEATGGEAGPGLFRRREGDGPVRHPHPRAHRRRLPAAPGHRVSHRRGDDRGHRLGTGGEAGGSSSASCGQSCPPGSTLAKGPCKMDCVLFACDEKTGPVHRRGADDPSHKPVRRPAGGAFLRGF